MGVEGCMNFGGGIAIHGREASKDLTCKGDL